MLKRIFNHLPLLQGAGLMAGLLLFSACSDDEPNGGDQEVEFNQIELFSNIGETLILPGYAELNEQANNLQQSAEAFTASPSATTLAAAREDLLAAQLAYQQVAPYQFGPADLIALQENINTFPPRFDKIENALSSNSWNFEGLYAGEIKGLPALDYLLYSSSSDEEVISAFTTAEHAENRKAYLNAVVADLNQYTAEVYNAWSPAGEDYLSSFSTNTGNSQSSSLSLMVNAMIRSYEEIKRLKIGRAAGKDAIDGNPIPKAVEAYYSGNSKQLAEAHLLAVKNTFLGRSAGTDRLGLDDYLNAYYEAGAVNTDVTADMLAAFAEAETALAAVPAPLSEAVVQNPDQVNAAYDALQVLVPLFKADMVSTLGVLISYTDNDGD